MSNKGAKSLITLLGCGGLFYGLLNYLDGNQRSSANKIVGQRKFIADSNDCSTAALQMDLNRRLANGESIETAVEAQREKVREKFRKQYPNSNIEPKF